LPKGDSIFFEVVREVGKLLMKIEAKSQKGQRRSLGLGDSFNE
jgi:hypothetical protein